MSKANDDTLATDSGSDPQRREELAAGSTHYRTVPDVPDVPDGATSALIGEEERAVSPPSAHSLRLGIRTRRGGLAGKIAVPIVVSLIAGLLFIFTIIYYRVVEMQINNLKDEAANYAYSLGVLGRLLLVHKDQFLAENPDYASAVEWPADEHWLVKHGFVSEADWTQATGFNPNEYAPVEILDKAAERLSLADMSRWLAAQQTGINVVGLFILDAANQNVASATSPAFRFDPIALRAIPFGEDFGSVGQHRLQVDHIEDFEPEPVVRGVARIMSAPDGGLQIGSAIVVIRTSGLTAASHSFLILLTMLFIILSGFTVFVVFIAARRATSPVRRLIFDMEAMAEGDFTRRSGLATVPDETGLLAQAFNSMAERLRVARANEKETARLESDLSVARGIQNNLLPLQTPRVRGIDISSSYRPAKEIGGDYYDFLPIDNQHIGFVVADASGKSIPAALVMSTTRAILRFVAPGDLSAAETLTRVNAILSVDIPRGMFVTAYYAILDPVARTLVCSSAGHTPLLIARADGSVDQINPGGIALGFDGGPIFQRSIREQKVTLSEGDRVLLYTDGVVECANTANEEYSDRRLREFLRRHRDLSSFEFVGALLADLDRYRGAAEIRDDTTIVTFKAL